MMDKITEYIQALEAENVRLKKENANLRQIMREYQQLYGATKQALHALRPLQVPGVEK